MSNTLLLAGGLMSELWFKCQNCCSNVGIVVSHPNLNNTIILMVIDHCSYDFITTSYLNHNPDIWTTILTFDRARQKWPVLSPQKAEMVAKKRHSPNPCWHGLFAKNWAQIGQICPLWPQLYSTSAYRGLPPCTLSQHQDNRETGYSNVLLFH